MEDMRIGPLSHRAIKRMFLGHPVKKPFLQVLNSNLVRHRGITCMALVLSDGVHFNRCYVVPKIIMDEDELITPVKYSLVKVSHYHRSVSDDLSGESHVFIEIDSMSVYKPRAAIRALIGHPLQFDEGTIPNQNAIVKTQFLPRRAPLSTGALERIKQGIIVHKPVVQIISVKMVNHDNNTRGLKNLVLLLCDGRQMEHIICNRALTRQLARHMLELKLSIVQLDNYGHVDEGRLNLREITWLNWGAHVCFDTNSITPQRSNLTDGSLRRILADGEYVPNPVVQVLKVENMMNRTESMMRMRLVIFDGQCVSDAYVSSQLEGNLRTLELRKCIIRVDIYKANQLNPRANHNFPFSRSSITICAMVVLNIRPTVQFNWSIMRHTPTLTNTYIMQLTAGQYVVKPVIKVVKTHFIFNGYTRKNYVRLLIYDGASTCFAILPGNMNHLMDYMEQLPTLRLDRYFVRSKSEADRIESMLVIKEMTGLSLQQYEVPSMQELENMRIMLPIFDDDFIQ